MKTILYAFAISMAVFPAAAQERASGLEAYLAAIDKAETDLEATCAALSETAPPTGRVWLRLGPEGVEIAPQDAEAAEAAAYWADAALGARTAAETLYGRIDQERFDDAPVMIETDLSGAVSVHDGGALMSGDICEAMRRLAGAFGGGAFGDPFAAARSEAQAEDRIAVAIGGAARAPLSGDFGADATARGPDGVIASIETGESGAFLNVQALGGATPGRGEVRIYDPSDPFRPIQTMPLTVAPGAARGPVRTSGELSLGGAYASTLQVGGAADLSLTVENPSQVVITSDAKTDLAARLETADGRLIAADDDSGDGYGFAIDAALEPGAYVLKLSHCCGGGGRFSVTAAPQAQSE